MSEAQFRLADPYAPRPTLSVLIKSFNHAKYIRKTIESVLDQPFQDFEIVVTDDGSTDGTADVVASFPDSRIRLERWADNRGISSAMNATIARSRGRYLAILNSDDWALPDRFTHQVAYLEDHPDVSLVCGRLRFVDEKGDALQSHFEPATVRFSDFEPGTFSRHFFFHGNCIGAPTVTLRREAYEITGRYDPRLLGIQDFDMWARMALIGLRFAFINREATAYRVRDNDMNASAEERSDVRIREQFEFSKVLARYVDLDEVDYLRIFGKPDIGWATWPVAIRVAELALRCGSPAHRSLALDSYFEHARTQQELRRLALLAGSLDTMGLLNVVAPEIRGQTEAPVASPKRWWRR